MTELEKIKNHLCYNSRAEELRIYSEKIKDLFFAYNQLPPSRREERENILREAFGKVGVNPWIESPFQCDMGFMIQLGDHVYINHNCMFLDCGGITIGNYVLMGPNVGIFTPEHAFDPALRMEGYEISRPVVIGDNVWIGGIVSIMGGVTIGENSIIGAGSVVTRDIPANVIAVGNPCRVLREITEEDKKRHDPHNGQPPL